MAGDKGSTSSGASQNPAEYIARQNQQIKKLEERLEELEEQGNEVTVKDAPTVKIPPPKPYNSVHDNIQTFITQATAYVYVARIPSKHEKVLAVRGMLTRPAAKF